MQFMIKVFPHNFGYLAVLEWWQDHSVSAWGNTKSEALKELCVAFGLALDVEIKEEHEKDK